MARETTRSSYTGLMHAAAGTGLAIVELATPPVGVWLLARPGKVPAGGVRAHVSPVLARVARLPHVTGLESPFTPAGARAISADGRTAFATVTFDERPDALPKSAVDRVIAVARSARTS